MRALILAAALVAASGAAALPAAAAAEGAAPTYSTDQTRLGVLLRDPQARAVIDRRIPGMTSDRRIGLARGMTLRQIQAHSHGRITAADLAQVDEDLAQLPGRK